MPNLTIASIFPMELTEERPKYRGLPYILAAAPKGSVSYLIVTDETQEVHVPLTEKTMPRTVPARDIVNDLVRCWTTNGRFMNPDCHPGIVIIAGDVATPEEILEMERVQVPYFRAEVDWADGMHRDKKTQGINPGARVACQWLGLEKEWLHPTAVTTCPYCGKPIPQNVPVCHLCGNIVNPKQYAELKRQADEVMAAVMEPTVAPLVPPPLEPPRTKAMGLR